jgi:hypothetical protein
VKIIAERGKVTLKEPCIPTMRNTRIEEHAKKYAGDIDNQLTVKEDTK